MENYHYQPASKRIRNTISTKDVLKHNPELQKAVEADSANEGKEGRNKRLPKSLRIAIREGKRKLGIELANEGKKAKAMAKAEKIRQEAEKIRQEAERSRQEAERSRLEDRRWQVHRERQVARSRQKREDTFGFDSFFG